MSSSAKQTAIKIAKQVAQEPLEILKTASRQVTGQEISRSSDGYPSTESNKTENENIKLKQEINSQRILSALDSELKSIRRDNLFKDLQQKIVSGQEVFLEDQDGLTIEQKEVLKAQIEAVAKQKEFDSKNVKSGFSLFGSSKPSRRFGAGQKQQAQKEQTRVEKPVPPSG